MHGVHSLRLPALTLSALLAATACSGGSSPPPRSERSLHGTSPSTAPSVISVSPTSLSGTTPIVVAFRGPVTSDAQLPTITPDVPGRWMRNGTTATFTPTISYPPSTEFTVSAVQPSGAVKPVATAVSDAGSLKFAAQILARLHYLPLDAKAAKPSDAAAEAAAVYLPPAGGFAWRYDDTPAELKTDWIPGKDNIVLRGAVIAFQHQAHLKADGAVGPATWKALQRADLDNRMNQSKYSYISANLYVPQRLSVWVDGETVLTTAVNGGVPAAPTPLGTYPIYLRYTATTMAGTNPDGTKYRDKGVPWVNYFSGGSAVHGFVRSSYGTPQSVGCLELPPETAKRVFDLVDYGTLVTVDGPFIKPPKVGKPSPPKPKHSEHPKPTETPGPSESASPSPSATATASPSPKPPRTHRPRR